MNSRISANFLISSGMALATAALLISPAPVAQAQDRFHRDRWDHGDIRRFHDHDYMLWRGGHWSHGFHEGRSGWWWVVGGVWYFYPQPVYPYPDPYRPPVVVAPAPAQSYYYCSNPQGYYPYVGNCLVPWQPVPVGSAMPQPQAAPPPPLPPR